MSVCYTFQSSRQGLALVKAARECPPGLWFQHHGGRSRGGGAVAWPGRLWWRGVWGGWD